MPPELYLKCPKCGHVYNVDRTLFDPARKIQMYCPLCMTRFDRDSATIVNANFNLGIGDLPKMDKPN